MGTKGSIFEGSKGGSRVVGTRTVEKEMKYVEDLNGTLVNCRPDGVENTTQSASVKCLANSNLMSSQKEVRKQDQTNFE